MDFRLQGKDSSLCNKVMYSCSYLYSKCLWIIDVFDKVFSVTSSLHGFNEVGVNFVQL